MAKKIHLTESQLIESHYNQAGTDFPCFYDEKNDVTYEAAWSNGNGYAFGYWPIDTYGTEGFFVTKAGETHCQACGQAAKEYYTDVVTEQVNDTASNIEDALSQIVSDMEEYKYTYNEEDDLWVSEDGSDEFDIYDKVSEIIDNLYYGVSESYIAELVEEAVKELKYPSSDEIANVLAEERIEEQSFYSQDDINNAMEDIGMSFQEYFEMGRNEGRIYPYEEIISFYTTEQPDPDTLNGILRDLVEDGSIGETYDELLNYVMIFEDWNNGGEVTACTISDFFDGNYGPEDEDEDNNDEEEQWAREGETHFVPHLANQDEKRKFFQDFRNTRDKALYVPRERGAKTLAHYHALRYPYGENIERLNKIIKEAIRKRLMEDK